MHTVAVLEQALNVARQLGYRVRQEWLDGHGAGACEFNGRRWIFVDLALTPDEQLRQVLDVLRLHPEVAALRVSPVLETLLPRRAA